MDYNKAINTVIMRRQRALDAAAALKARLIEENTQFYENEKMLRLAQIALAKGEQADVDGILAARRSILARLNLTEADLQPPPECDLCGDSGLYEGKPCRCALKTMTQQEATFNDLPLHSLAQASLAVYDEKNRAAMTKIYDVADKLINSFPDNNRRNIIFMGKSGSGKTFLAGCIAGALLKKGYGVVSMTAFGFVNTMLKYHTTFNEEKMKYLSPVLESDLLIIDDLGSESMLKNVTVEYLYLVLNERMTKRKHTLITTNLNPDSITQRYGERICSRLFEKRVSLVLPFVDEDLRDALVRKSPAPKKG